VKNQGTSLEKAVCITLRRRSFWNFYIVLALFGMLTLIYYFGELARFAGWTSVQYDFFYTVHDLYRLLFLAPILFASYHFKIKGALATTFAAFIIFLPRALFISTYPDPLLRVIAFVFIAGTISVLVGITRNEIERRNLYRNKLTAERDKLFGILERMEDGVMITAPDFKIRFMNTSMANEFGKGTGTCCYEHLLSFDSPCKSICRLPEVINGVTARWEYSLPDGRTYEVIASPFTDSDGVVCQLATMRNITRRKQVEQELIKVNQLKSDLLSNVTHEFRSPLTSIKGIISSLLQKDIEWDDQNREMLLTGISEETDRLASLVTNLLNMSKLEAGVWVPEKEPCNIADTINSAVKNQKWVHKDYILDVEINPDLPEINADQGQIKQVLINLIENATAYSEKGTTISIRAKYFDNDIEVQVSDQGSGIPEKDLKKIFEKFYRGSQNRKRPGGTGLGLSICHAIITGHGGQIWVESEVTRGSTFYFRLPVSRVNSKKRLMSDGEKN
jgi:signal transduction histidine kinase